MLPVKSPFQVSLPSGSPSPILHSTSTGMIFLKCPFHPGEPFLKCPNAYRKIPEGHAASMVWQEALSGLISTLSTHEPSNLSHRSAYWAQEITLGIAASAPRSKPLPCHVVNCLPVGYCITVPHPPAPTSFIKASVLPPLTFAPTLLCWLLSFNNLYKMITGLPCLPVWAAPRGHQFFEDKALCFCFLAFLFFMNLSTWHSSML